MPGKAAERNHIFVPQEHHEVVIRSLFRPERDPNGGPTTSPDAHNPEAQMCEIHVGLAESQQEQFLLVIHGCEARKTPMVMLEDHPVYI